MENVILKAGPVEAKGSIGSRISDFLFLFVCVFMLFSISLILFDKGAVLVAEEMISSNPPVPW